MVNRTQYKQAKKLYLDLFPEERDNFEDNLDVLTGPPGPPGTRGVSLEGSSWATGPA